MRYAWVVLVDISARYITASVETLQLLETVCVTATRKKNWNGETAVASAGILQYCTASFALLI